jgi:nucleotide-binding universal stress UspA family protein
MEQKILVPLDGSALSERAIEPAEKIAKAIGYEMILFRVVDSPLERTPGVGPEEERRAASASIDKATTYLKAIASRIEGRGIRTRIEIGVGSPYSAIIALADKEDVEFIIMSTHGRTGLSRALMGSVAEKVVHMTERPVMLVKPEKIHKTRTDEEKAILSARG